MPLEDFYQFTWCVYGVCCTIKTIGTSLARLCVAALSSLKIAAKVQALVIDQSAPDSHAVTLTRGDETKPINLRFVKLKTFSNKGGFERICWGMAKVCQIM